MPCPNKSLPPVVRTVQGTTDCIFSRGGWRAWNLEGPFWLGVLPRGAKAVGVGSCGGFTTTPEVRELVWNLFQKIKVFFYTMMVVFFVEKDIFFFSVVKSGRLVSDVKVGQNSWWIWSLFAGRKWSSLIGKKVRTRHQAELVWTSVLSTWNLVLTKLLYIFHWPTKSWNAGHHFKRILLLNIYNT